jgi:hypothetical protein
MPPGGETADGQKYARSVLQHKIGETAEGKKYAQMYLNIKSGVLGKEEYCTVHT